MCSHGNRRPVHHGVPRQVRRVVRADGEVGTGVGEHADRVEHDPGDALVVAGVERRHPRGASGIESIVIRGWSCFPTSDERVSADQLVARARRPRRCRRRSRCASPAARYASSTVRAGKGGPAMSGTIAAVERTFVGLPSPVVGRAGAGGHPCQGIYHTPAGRRPDDGVHRHALQRRLLRALPRRAPRRPWLRVPRVEHPLPRRRGVLPARPRAGRDRRRRPLAARAGRRARSCCSATPAAGR